ncbi:IS3 family transposase [Ferrimonas balearica]|uniref:IS3 family transposase n=1 Tax=Ferrimonas balearica TaxID=44012 RepID=UPI001FEDF87F|nr:IS3 family transposase [Ferrimonas balearica]
MDKPKSIKRKRTQRDYPMSFKLAVVRQVEEGALTYRQAQEKYGIQGRSTVLVWLRKHGQCDWSPAKEPTMTKESPAQKIKRLEKDLEDERLRNLVLNEMIDVLDEKYGTQLRKKLLANGLRRLQSAKQITIARACRLFGLCRQTLYRREYRQRNKQRVYELVHDMVLDIRRHLPRLGGRKLHAMLVPKFVEAGIKMGRDGLFDCLRHYQLLVPNKRSYTKTTDSRHWLKKYPNLLSAKELTGPEQAFVSDITYVRSGQGVHYLSLVTDAWSRKIMGYHLSKDLSATETVKAMELAIRNRSYSGTLIHHSDRGIQYCSAVYQRLLGRNGITASMTDGYDCYQNALAERVNGILKHEFLVYQAQDFAELLRQIKQSVWAYNELRPHLSLGMKTPAMVHEKASYR